VPDGVEIDPKQVDQVAQDLRNQADSGLADTANRGADLHRHGVVFGASIPGDTVLSAKQRYAKALENTDANLRAHQQMAGILASAAEQIARDFDSVDLSAAEKQRRAEALMTNAVSQADAIAAPQADPSVEGLL